MASELVYEARTVSGQFSVRRTVQPHTCRLDVYTQAVDDLDRLAAELRRVELNEQADAYLEELITEVGEPSARERARADAIARRIRDRAARDAV